MTTMTKPDPTGDETPTADLTQLPLADLRRRIRYLSAEIPKHRPHWKAELLEASRRLGQLEHLSQQVRVLQELLRMVLDVERISEENRERIQRLGLGGSDG